MKSIMPWVCLAATASVHVAFAQNGVDAYRQGDYLQAATQLSHDSNKDSVVDYYMGRMWLYGYGQLKNNLTALRYFKQAAEKGFLPAQRFMARYALLKENNPEQALVWFKKAAEANDINAQMYCAAAYLFGVGTAKNSDLAKRYYIAAAKSGQAVAQVALAKSFLDSRQVVNKKLGLIWLNKAVAQKNLEAQVMLAELYANGTLVERDLTKAKDMIQAAVAQKYVPALFVMGDIARQEGKLDDAKNFYTQAAQSHYSPAEMALSQLYLQAKSPMYDPHTGFLWMLKSAQSGSTDAQLALAAMYKNGQGVEKDESLAKAWQLKAKSSAKDTAALAQQKAAQWLTNGNVNTLALAGYAMRGILGNWHNPEALQENNYNAAPQMDTISRQALYQPKFVMTNPNEIPISDYYDALAASLSNSTSDAFAFLRYALKKPSNSTIPSVDQEGVLKQLQGRAALGDPTAQFRLGQMYQAGQGVKKDVQEAIKYYRMATAQQELRAEYNLGMLYLEGDGVTPDYPQAITTLRDAAFKGNDYAQYALARLDEVGFHNAAGELVVPPDPEQAISMYDLAAANNNGLAQYRLAELLVREKKTDMSVAGLKKRNEMVKQLYQGAFSEGVSQAALPLAFFNAMDQDKGKQAEAFRVAHQEARAGNPVGALLLGLLFDRGISVDANQAEALHWYEKAESNPIGAYVLGTYMSQGMGVSKDTEKGMALLQKAADAGFSYANFNVAILKKQAGGAFLPELEAALAKGNSTAGLLLADYYLSLANNDQQMQQARDIYQKLADKGDKEAQLKLGFMFEQGLGGAVDAGRAEAWYASAAAQGQWVAQYLLGHLYQMGLPGKQPDYELARKWYGDAKGHYAPAAVALGFLDDTVSDNYQQALGSYQLAVTQQDPVGQFNAGLMYEKGKGIPVDFAKANTLYSMAAEQGHQQAMVQLAGLYFNGSLGSRDESQALRWYKKAAELGNADALYQLGLLSETGVAMKLDFSEAIRLYQQAADKGNAKAMFALARIYQYGLGVAKNSSKAIELYKTLADLGNGSAQYHLAMLYEDASDGSHTLQQSKELLQQAASNGNQQACRVLQWLDAQSATHASFVEPALMNHTPVLAGESADLMYLNALSAWNRGEEGASRMILDRIIAEYPDYTPAKQASEQLHRQWSPGIVKNGLNASKLGA